MGDMYLLLKTPYLLASRFATVTSAPALGPFVFGFRVPLELSDGRRGEILAILPVGLFLSRSTAHSYMHWISSAVFIGIYAFGVFIVLQCIFLYVP